MNELQSIAVFCASSAGKEPKYLDLAAAVGRQLAEAKLTVVYGGSRNGMMGALADGAIAAGGAVIGVIPELLGGREIAHTGLTRLDRVSDMHERKMCMHGLSDAVLALPGGFGTLDELVEMITWRQMDMHQKPIALLNAFGYFDSLLAFFEHARGEGLIRDRDYPIFFASADFDEILLHFKHALV